MSSYMMHLCVSNKVKEKLNLTDEFLYGAILPDIVKQAGEPRIKNHFIQTVVKEGKVRELPDIQKAIDEIVVGKNKERELGFIAHLIEDYIWFSAYIPAYAEKYDNGQVIYIKDNSVHTADEFRDDMYSDYTNTNKYVISIIGKEKIEKIKEKLIDIASLEEYKKIVNEGIRLAGEANLNEIVFMTKESIDSYIYQTTNEVERVISKLLGENNE